MKTISTEKMEGIQGGMDDFFKGFCGGAIVVAIVSGGLNPAANAISVACVVTDLFF
jgi:hypothetical protein